MNKQKVDPPAPIEIVEGVPPDLNDLCVRLLRRDPEERPWAVKVVRSTNRCIVKKGIVRIVARFTWSKRLRARVFSEAILDEARGNPFLLEQLARYAATRDQTSTTGITLAVMLEERLRHLPVVVREFLDTLAVAGRPINSEVAYQAAKLTPRS